MSDTNAVTGDRPLAGLKVLDFSRVLAGPFAGRMLADLGADVVKIEPPEGDVTRLWGRRVAGIAGYFAQQNAGKRDLCLDLSRPGAAEFVARLAEVADVVVENFRPGVMDRLGIGYEVLSAVNPRLVMLSISGFGQAGPESGRAAYAPIVHAESGVVARQAAFTGTPAAELPLSVADTNAALHGLVGLLAALWARERTGRGDHLDVAMLDAMLATDDHLHYALEDAEHTRPMQSEVWETAIGPVMLSGDFRHLWKLLVEHCGVEDPTPAGASLEEKIAARRRAAADCLAGLPDRDALVAQRGPRVGDGARPGFRRRRGRPGRRHPTRGPVPVPLPSPRERGARAGAAPRRAQRRGPRGLAGARTGGGRGAGGGGDPPRGGWGRGMRT
jgi:crotonobetainyl-CoA:carnitine CoA-transferase CaiB-like acyl-CoA transferase